MKPLTEIKELQQRMYDKASLCVCVCEGVGGGGLLMKIQFMKLSLWCKYRNVSYSSPHTLHLHQFKKRGNELFMQKKIWEEKHVVVVMFNDMLTLVGHFVSTPREREKRDRRDEREGQRRKRNRNESEGTEEIKTFPLYPYLQRG